jgi:hypothetical protein
VMELHECALAAPSALGADEHAAPAVRMKTARFTSAGIFGESPAWPRRARGCRVAAYRCLKLAIGEARWGRGVQGNTSLAGAIEIPPATPRSCVWPRSATIDSVDAHIVTTGPHQGNTWVCQTCQHDGAAGGDGATARTRRERRRSAAWTRRRAFNSFRNESRPSRPIGGPADPAHNPAVP